ncbi:hypothetical protein HY638_01450 [Candidatus Woesearchaeota archaeon]|nr:hypothetical protein [Candidatus Woesearchaeota archaeon]
MDNPKWSREEVNKTVEILMRSKQKKSRLVRFLDEVVYITAFIVALLINFVISVVLVPIMLVFSGFWLYVLIIILALSFGFLFDILMRDIESLQFRHHLINSIVIPGIAIINLIIVGTVANLMEADLRLNNVPHSPILEGVVYAVFFVLPYVYHHFYKK